jgi:predicted nucleotide-binding protein
MDSKLKIIETLINEGESYLFSNFCRPHSSNPRAYAGADTPEWAAFKIRVRNVVSQLAADSSPAVKLMEDGFFSHTEDYDHKQFENAKANLIEALRIISRSLDNDVYGELKKPKSEAKSASLSNKVFIVHGHDHGLKTDVERFLHEIGLTPIVLHREADQGATVIEKFEKHGDVGYAFILFTPDEICFTVDQANIADDQRKKEYRARPNVIFEFGYFVGRLGRDKVCCLLKGDVTVPSDLGGLIYKKIDSSIDSEAMAIIRDLKAIGYKINL